MQFPIGTILTKAAGSALERVLPGGQPNGPAGPTTGAAGSSTPFAETLKNLNDTQTASYSQGEGLVRGEASNLHQVVSQVEEASLTLNLAVALRNKAVEAYQEVMRIQV